MWYMSYTIYKDELKMEYHRTKCKASIKKDLNKVKFFAAVLCTTKEEVIFLGVPPLPPTTLVFILMDLMGPGL